MTPCCNSEVVLIWPWDSQLNHEKVILYILPEVLFNEKLIGKSP